MFCQRQDKKDEESENAIKWTDNGESFEIIDSASLRKILGKHFRSDKYKSLVRQLNIHGFKRDRDCDRVIYTHMMFKRGNFDDLRYIKRVAVKTGVKNQEDIEIENVEDYDVLTKRLAEYKKEFEAKTQYVKELTQEHQMKESKHVKDVSGKEMRVLKMLHLLFKSKGNFNKQQLQKIGKSFPALEFVLNNLRNKNDLKSEILTLLNSISNIDSFADSVYNLFSNELKIDSLFNTPFKKNQDDGFKVIVPVFGVSPIKSCGKNESERARDTDPIIDNSIFKTPIKEPEGEIKSKDNVADVRGFIF